MTQPTSPENSTAKVKETETEQYAVENWVPPESLRHFSFVLSGDVKLWTIYAFAEFCKTEERM